MPRGSEPPSLTRGLCLPTNGRTVSISTVPSGPSGLNGSPRKRSIGEEFSGAGWALTTGLANFLSPSISAHTLVVAGSMYPPKTIGSIGLPLLAASIATWMFPAGAANAFLTCFNIAAPATEAFRSSRRFIGMLSLLVLVSSPCPCCTRRSPLRFHQLLRSWHVSTGRDFAGGVLQSVGRTSHEDLPCDLFRQSDVPKKGHANECSLGGIGPGFPFCHSGPVLIIRPTASFGAVSLIFHIPNDAGGPGGANSGSSE